MPKFLKRTSLLLTLILGSLPALGAPIFGVPPLLLDSAFQDCMEETALSQGWTDTAEVVFLNCPDRDIESAAGISHFPNLEYLDISDNQLTHLDELNNVTPLRYLDVRNNDLQSPPNLLGAPYTHLQALYLSGNPALTLPDVQDLLMANVGLERLDVGGMQVGDLGLLPLVEADTGQPVDLRELRVPGTGISDLALLASFPNIEILDLSDNPVDDIGVLDPLVLEYLDLRSTRIDTLVNLQGQTELRALHLDGYSGVPLFDALPLVGQNLQLIELSLPGFGLVDLNQLPLQDPATQNYYALEVLELSDNDLVDITQLGNFPALRLLRLNDNAIDDISSLGGLLGLRELELARNQIDDWTPLYSLSGLTTLWVSDNAWISYDLDPVLHANPNLVRLGIGGYDGAAFVDDLPLYNPLLQDYLALEALDISGTGLENDIGLGHFANLEYLDISDNQLTHLDELNNVTPLRFLDVRNNDLQSPPNLLGAPYTHLQALYLSGNPALTLPDVQDLLMANVGLERLDVGGMQVGDLGLLPLVEADTGQPVDLRELRVPGTGISDLALLASFPNIEILDLSDNPVDDIGVLDPLVLEYLDLRSTRIDTLVNLQGQTELRALHLDGYSGVPLFDALPLVGQNLQLIELSLPGFGLVDLNQLPLQDPATQNYYALEVLELSDNDLVDITQLGNFPALRLLRLNDNAIDDISSLGGLLGLRELELARNQIDDWTPLYSLSGLTTLWVSDNAWISYDLDPVLHANPNLVRLGIGGYDGATFVDDLPLYNPLLQDYLALEALDISGTGLENDIGLGHFTNLEYLDISDNQLTHLDELNNVTPLRFLDVRNNDLQSPPNLLGAPYTHLQALYLSGNPALTLPDVQDLLMANVGLERLDVGGMQVGDLGLLPLVEADTGQPVDLRELRVPGTGISDLALLASFPNIEILDLSGNPITEILILDQFVQLSWLDLTGITGLQCADLDYLEGFYGTSVLQRPAQCDVLNPPVVAILYPFPGEDLFAGIANDFTGDAEDAEDGDISHTLLWTSDIDGLLGSGALLPVVLSEGTHLVSATVTDSHGNTREDVVSVDVLPLPTGDITGDGNVDSADVLLAARAVTGQLQLSIPQIQRGDVAPLVNGSPNPDGQFTLGDWLLIQRKVLGLVSFP